jgi:hypothetical protein
MVFYFLTKVVDPPMVIYMGADKYESIMLFLEYQAILLSTL